MKIFIDMASLHEMGILYCGPDLAIFAVQSGSQCAIFNDYNRSFLVY